MYDKSQLMRGTLEGCILKILSKNTSYGYEIVTTLLGCPVLRLLSLIIL